MRTVCNNDAYDWRAEAVCIFLLACWLLRLWDVRSAVRSRSAARRSKLLIARKHFVGTVSVLSVRELLCLGCVSFLGFVACNKQQVAAFQRRVSVYLGSSR